MNKNFWNKAAIYGLLLAFVTIIVLLLQSVVTLGTTAGMLVSIVKLIVTGTLLYYFMKEYGKEVESYDFGNAFRFGVAVSFCSSIVAVAYYFIHLNFLFPESMDTMTNVMAEALKSTPETSEIDAGAFLNRLPVITCISLFFYYNILGLIWSVALAGAAKHKDPSSPFV